MYINAYVQRASRVLYETGIKRPYFHVQPLEEAQLLNWSQYLDFEEKEIQKHKLSNSNNNQINNNSIGTIINTNNSNNSKTTSSARLIKLFERCLVTCANYPQFWKRYAGYVERTDVKAAREIHKRAAFNFVKRQ